MNLSKPQTCFVFLPLLGAVPCPESHPFAVGNANYCCSTRTKINLNDPSSDCDGTTLHARTSRECCIEAMRIPCHAHACADRPTGKSDGTFSEF